jgi:hypothetical protein
MRRREGHQERRWTIGTASSNVMGYTSSDVRQLGLSRAGFQPEWKYPLPRQGEDDRRAGCKTPSGNQE